MSAVVVPVEVDDFAQIVAKLLVMRETIDDALALLERVSGRKFRDLALAAERIRTHDPHSTNRCLLDG